MRNYPHFDAQSENKALRKLNVKAVVCDYFFLVKLFKPADGYYKLDVYMYYFLTLTFPLIIGWRKNVKN